MMVKTHLQITIYYYAIVVLIDCDHVINVNIKKESQHWIGK